MPCCPKTARMPFAAAVVVTVLGGVCIAQAGGANADPEYWPRLHEQLAAIAADGSLGDGDRIALTLGLAEACREAAGADSTRDGGYTTAEEFVLACVRVLAQGCRPEALLAALRDPEPVAAGERPIILFAWAASRGGEALHDPAARALSAELQELLTSSPAAFLRASAAEALGALRDRSADGHLKTALADGAYRTGRRVSDDPASERVYIVRRAAALALQRLGHEVERPAFDTWVVDPPLITGVAPDVLLAKLGGDWRSTRVGAFGREWVQASDPSTLVSVGVFASYWEARGAVLAAIGAVPAPPAVRLGGLGDVAFGWGDCTVLVAVGNAVIGVCAAAPGRALQLARAAADALGDSADCVTLGRPVPMPDIRLEHPLSARPGDEVWAKWRTEDGVGVLFGLGAQEPRHAGVTPLDLHETALAEAATDLCFATPECVMVRKTVIIKVVPWEDEEPAEEDE